MDQEQNIWIVKLLAAAFVSVNLSLWCNIGNDATVMERGQGSTFNFILPTFTIILLGTVFVMLIEDQIEPILTVIYEIPGVVLFIYSGIRGLQNALENDLGPLMYFVGAANAVVGFLMILDVFFAYKMMTYF